MQGSKAGSYLEGNCARANEALAVYAAAFAAAHCALVWMTSARPLSPVLAKGKNSESRLSMTSLTKLDSTRLPLAGLCTFGATACTALGMSLGA